MCVKFWILCIYHNIKNTFQIYSDIVGCLEDYFWGFFRQHQLDSQFKSNPPILQQDLDLSSQGPVKEQHE